MPPISRACRIFALLTALLFLALEAGRAAAQTTAPPPTDQAVAYQINVAHTGSVTTPGLAPPLVRKWQTDLGADVSYPLIVSGKVFVTTGDNNGHPASLYALDAATGHTVWGPVSLQGTFYWANACYDGGMIFAVNDAGRLWACDAATGATLWSKPLPGQYTFSSAPTAHNGVVYVGGAGSGGTLYAVRESDGAVLWADYVINGDSSSPALGDDGVYVCYVGPQFYKFDLAAGLLRWHDTSSNDGGGGTTPVLSGGRLYARNPLVAGMGDVPNGQVLDAALGTQLGTFSAGPAPALDGGGLFTVMNGTLQAQDAVTLGGRWFTAIPGDPYVTAPVVVNSVVYAGTQSGRLDALDAVTGVRLWSDALGESLVGSDEFDLTRPLSGLAAGQGLLVVPAGTRLVAYAASGSPVLPILSGLSPNTVGASGVGFNLTATGSNLAPGAAVYWNGTPLATTFVSATQLTAAVPAALTVTAGTARVLVRAGGATSGSLPFTITNPAPTLSAVNPASASAGGPDLTLTATGSNFAPGATVNWNGTPLTTVAQSATTLTATVPAALTAVGGTVSVTVTNPAPGGGTSAAQTFAVTNPAPTMTGLSPNSAPADGSSVTVTVTGTGFVSGSLLSLGNGGYVTPTTITPTQMTVFIPGYDLSTTPGVWNFSVYNSPPSGGSSGSLPFTLTTPIPAISGLYPTQATAGGGPLSLVIDGAGFVPGSVPQWNGTPLAVVGHGSTQITATVPAALTVLPGTAQITVSNGAAGLSNAVSLPIVIGTPALSTISPLSVAAGGPDLTVILTGTGFLPNSWVQANGMRLTTTYVSGSQLTAVLPAAQTANGGSVYVQVYNPAPGGGSSSLLLGVVSPAPTLTALSPSQAVAGGPAFTLTVTGTGFVGTPGVPTYYDLRGSVVQWNGYTQVTTFLSPTQLSITVPAADIAAVGTAQVTVASPAPGGGTTAALPFTVAADTSAPTTTASLGGTSGANGWYTSPVPVTLSATDPDGAADVAATHYTLDGGPAQTYATPFTISGDGTHALMFWSVDRAGNVEAANSRTVKIDATAPTIAFGSPAPAPNAAGWSNAPVSILYTAGDATSGVASAGPGSPVQISGEGRGQTVPVMVADNAGNRVTANSPAANIDRTAPVTTGAVAGAQVTLSATDALSGVAATFYTLDKGAAQSYAAPFTVSGAGMHTVTFWSRDVAGNVEPSHTLSVTVPPAGYVTVTPNVAGNTNLWWGQENVGISSAQTITALTVTIKVKQTGGLSFHDQFYTGPWGPLAQSRASSASALTYTWAMKPGQSIPPGAWYCAAQWNGTGLPHPTLGDTYTVSATAGGRSQTFSGHF